MSIYDQDGDDGRGLARAAGGGGGGPGGEEPAPEAEKGPGFFGSMSMGYEELVNAIIRPPRAEYDVEDMGSRELRVGQLVVTRQDLELPGHRGKLVCSHWEPGPASRSAVQMPCVIYMHGNCGCRAEAMDILDLVLSGGMTLFALDFGGCGLSEGEHISLGWWEREDLDSVVKYLRGEIPALDGSKCETVSTLGLWGRSMGAVTALLHGDRDPSIAAMVLDSPFSSLRELAGELVNHLDFKIPSFAVSAALSVVKSSVKKRAGFNLDELAPVEHADRCFIPALFGHADDDDFILKRHSELIHAKYAGDKNMVTFPGDHNSQRPQFFHASALIWLQNTMLQGAPPPVSSPGVMNSPRVGLGGTDQSAAAVAAAIEAQAAAPSFYPSTQERLGGIGLPMAAGAVPPPAAAPARQEHRLVDVPVSQEGMALLMSMGFPQQRCEMALRATGNDAERATDWMFSHMDDVVVAAPGQDDAPLSGGDLDASRHSAGEAADGQQEAAVASSVLPPAVLVSADGGDGGGSGGIPAAFLGGVEMGEDEDADLQSALALSMQQAPALEAVGSDGGEVSSSSAAAAAAAESIATDAGAEVQQQPAEGEEAAAVAQLSELFGDAVSDEEALRALRDRHGNLELAFGDLSSRLGS
jgi:alpha/beta superfamily hydrolase